MSAPAILVNFHGLQPTETISQAQKNAIHLQGVLGGASKVAPVAYEAFVNLAISYTSLALSTVIAFAAAPYVVTSFGFSFTGSYFLSLVVSDCVLKVIFHQVNNAIHTFDLRVAKLLLAKRREEVGDWYGIFDVLTRLEHKKPAPAPAPAPAAPAQSSSGSSSSSSSSSSKPVEEASVQEVAEHVNKYVLLIGNNYEGTHNPLSNCRNDADDQKQLYMNAGVPEKNIVVMTDEAKNVNTTLFPSAANVKDQLKAQIKKVNGIFKEQATHHGASTASQHKPMVIVHVSGHGTTKPNPAEKYGVDSVMVTTEQGNQLGFIVDNELKQILSDLDPNLTAFFTFDCCHSGTMLDLENEYSVDFDNAGKAQITKDERKDEKQFGLTAMFSGCKDKQVSSDGTGKLNGKGAGAMTLSFITTVLEHAYNVSFEDLLLGMNYKLRAAGIPNQNPVLTTSCAVNLKASVFQSSVDIPLHNALLKV